VIIGKILNVKKSWEELTITTEDEGNQIQEKIQLPSQASSYVSSFLFSVCQEISRIGSHNIDRLILNYLAHRLCLKICSIYMIFLSKRKEQPSREGHIQMLFDVWLLLDILSGRVPHGNTELTEALELIQNCEEDDLSAATGVPSKKQEEELLTQLRNQFDPIDIAFYEAPLRKYVQRCYHRTSILFGSLQQLNKMHKEFNMRTSLSTTEGLSVMAIAKPASMFPQLVVAYSQSNENKSNTQPSIQATTNTQNYTVKNSTESERPLSFMSRAFLTSWSSLSSSW